MIRSTFYKIHVQTITKSLHYTLYFAILVTLRKCCVTENRSVGTLASHNLQLYVLTLCFGCIDKYTHNGTCFLLGLVRHIILGHGDQLSQNSQFSNLPYQRSCAANRLELISHTIQSLTKHLEKVGTGTCLPLRSIPCPFNKGLKQNIILILV